MRTSHAEGVTYDPKLPLQDVVLARRDLCLVEIHVDGNGNVYIDEREHLRVQQGVHEDDEEIEISLGDDVDDLAPKAPRSCP